MLTLQFYINAFGNDPAKLEKMKGLIEEDFKKAEQLFFEADDANDLLKMKAQLHKIYPIVSNLKYAEFVSLINMYKTHEQYNSEVSSLNVSLREYFTKIYLFLKT